MAKRIRAKLVLELLAKGMSGREIRSTRRISQRSIKLVREAAGRVGVTWEDVSGMTDGEVYDLLFPAQRTAADAYAEPDWEWVHTELQRDGVTLKLLWEEHRDEAARDGLVTKSYNTFCRGYQAFVTARGVTNHLEHKPGQVMEVDWNGTPMWLTDPATGDATKAHLFVATLPYSQYSYVEATLDMRQNTWLACHVHAWDFFGGVAVRTVCDNMKCAAAHFMFNGGSRVMRSPGAKRLVRSQRTPHYILVSVGSPKSEEECHDRRKKGLPQSQVQHRGVQQQQVQGLRPSHGRRA